MILTVAALDEGDARVVSLALEQRDLQRISAPVMGVSILVGIAVYSWRIVSPRRMAVRSAIEAA